MGHRTRRGHRPDPRPSQIANNDGETDLALSAPTPAQTRYSSGERVSTLTSYTAIDGAWHSTTTHTNALSTGTTRHARDIDLTVGHGRLSDDLRSLAPIRTVQFDVAADAQIALYMPVPTSVPAARS